MIVRMILWLCVIWVPAMEYALRFSWEWCAWD